MGPTLKKGDKVYLLRKNIKTLRLSDKLDNKKIGLYEIDEVIRLVNFRLRLLKHMKIYLVFHIALLELAPHNAPLVLETRLEP
jgi:hypothetical protein